MVTRRELPQQSDRATIEPAGEIFGPYLLFNLTPHLMASRPKMVSLLRSDEKIPFIYDDGWIDAVRVDLT